MEMHKTYNVKPFRYIKIGDPMYLDDIETSKDIKMVKRLKKLVLNQKTPFTNRETKEQMRLYQILWGINVAVISSIKSYK